MANMAVVTNHKLKEKQNVLALYGCIVVTLANRMRGKAFDVHIVFAGRSPASNAVSMARSRHWT